MTESTEPSSRRTWLKRLGITLAVLAGVFVLLAVLVVATFANGFM